MTVSVSHFGVKRYRLHEVLGQGGMGVVYRATDRLTGQDVALKQVLTPVQSLDFQTHTGVEEVHLALVHEFQTLASLRHPHIVSVLDYGFDEQHQPFFTMELISNAKTLLEAASGQTVSTRIDLLMHALQALAYLHRRGVLHRDLKPGNLLVTSSASVGDTQNAERLHVKLVDFGLAVAQEQAKGLAGTVAYLAPEVLRGQSPTVASDLYAIGVMAYELLVGRHPFDVSVVGKLIHDVLSSEPDLSSVEELDTHTSSIPPTSNTEVDATLILEPAVVAERQARPFQEYALRETAPKTLAGVIRRLLAKDPTQRYSDVLSVMDDLSAAIGQEAPAETQAIRESYLQAARFVSREAELSRLTSGLGRVITPPTDEKAVVGSMWLIGGESGVGKSRLMDELRIHALVGGALVLRGQAFEGGGLPYQVWRDVVRLMVLFTDLSDLEVGILRDVVPDIGKLLQRDVVGVPELPGQDHQQRLALTMVEVFRRQTQPVVLLLEDLQWAAESLEPLKRLNRVAAQLPLLIVGSYRNDEAPRLPATLAGMEIIMLSRLDKASIARLSKSIIGNMGESPALLDLLERETEGNAFFLVEVMRALAEESGRLADVGKKELPERVLTGGIQQVLRRRLDCVPDWGRELLRLAAVGGRYLDVAVLRYLDRVPGFGVDGWLMVGISAGVMEVHENQWRFTHDKLRETLLADLSSEAQRDAHQQVAEAIEQVYAANLREQAPRLVEHWRQAGNTAKEQEYSLIAGQQVYHLNLFRQALTYYQRSLTLLGEDGPIEQRAMLHYSIGDTYFRMGDIANATEALQTSLALAVQDGTSDLPSQILTLLGEITFRGGDFDEAKGYLDQALAHARERDDESAMSNALRQLGAIASFKGDYDEAAPLLLEALTRYEALNNPIGIVRCLNALGVMAGVQGRYDEASDYMQKTFRIAHEVGDRSREGTILLNLGEIARKKGDLATARRYYEDSLAINREIDDQLAIAVILTNLGMVAVATQDLVNAEKYLRDGLRLFHDLGANSFIFASFVWLARLQSKNSQPERGTELLGLVLNQADLLQEIREEAELLLQEFRDGLDPMVLAEGMERGKTLDVSATLSELIRGY